jgi:hypothetical protein
MMKKKRPSILITKRDIDIFVKLYEQKVMMMGQIIEFFFKGSNLANTYKRIASLEHFGYLNRGTAIYNGKRVTTFNTTIKALSYINGSLKYTITAPVFKESSTEHDLALTDIRQYLESKEIIRETICENVIQTTDCIIENDKCRSFQVLNTDLAVNIVKKGESFWLPFEWEASDKGKTRLLEKLTSYHSVSEIPAIFYLCSDNKIERNIRRCEQTICKNFSPKVFTCVLKNTLINENSLQFTNINNDKFIIE